MKYILFLIISLVIGIVSSLPPLPLTTKGKWVVDAKGDRVKFAGVNWYGFDSTDFVAGGLQANTLENIVDLIADWGFTAIRVPWSLELWEKNPKVNATMLKANPDLIGLRGLDILDRFIEALAARDILIMLDNHVSIAGWCCSETDGNGLWFTEGYPETSWYNDWLGIVARYKNVSHVVAVDLRNEPRCFNDNCAVWGGGSIYDWPAAATLVANAIHKVNPDLLIVVEGVSYALELQGVKTDPIKLDIPNKLVYSAHDYPWDYTITSCADFYNNDLTPHWFYILQENIAPLFVGEWGTCNAPSSCVKEQQMWMECFTDFMKENDLDWFYWSLDGTESSGQGRTWNKPSPFGLTDPTWSNASWPWFLENKLQTMQNISIFTSN